jgi:hypothetical protein
LEAKAKIRKIAFYATIYQELKKEVAIIAKNPISKK